MTSSLAKGSFRESEDFNMMATTTAMMTKGMIGFDIVRPPKDPRTKLPLQLAKLDLHF